MSDIGHPVVGDKKYGSRNNAIGRLGLHANAIELKHPTTGESIRFESKTPASFTRPFNK
jgi:23S rRNA pseudouridine1911/1915/1917 synthase